MARERERDGVRKTNRVIQGERERGEKKAW